MKTLYILIVVMVSFLMATSSASAVSYDLVIAREDSAYDLAVAQVYAYTAGIPILAVTQESLGEDANVELSTYAKQGYTQAIIIGGEKTVPKKIEEELISFNYTITRLWDWNKYGTAARAALSLWNESNVVVVAQSDEKGNLLYATRLAVSYKSPLLFTKKSSVPSETKQAIERLKAVRIIIAGNIDENTRKELASLGSIEQKSIRSEEAEPGSVGYIFIGILIGISVVFIASGILGVKWLRKRGQIPYSILQEDEQKIVELIQKNKGIIKQQELPSLSGFSRPKVSRLVFELERRGIFKREKTGKTRIVKIVKNVVK